MIRGATYALPDFITHYTILFFEWGIESKLIIVFHFLLIASRFPDLDRFPESGGAGEWDQRGDSQAYR